MARRPTRAQLRRQFETLAAEWEPRLRDAFLEAVTDIKSGVSLRLLVERLERGDVQGALDVLQIERSAFGRLELAIAEAFNAGGLAQANNSLNLRDPEGNRIVFRFGVRNPAAEAWLRNHSSTLVTRITDDMRQAVRQHLATGLELGQNPRQTALSLVGRINRATNSRQGGVIGLTAAQERFVVAARQELLSGDPAALRHYLARERRDKRFDAAVLRAIRDGRALDQEAVNRMVGRYSDRLLALRGEMLARSETMTSLNGGRVDAMRQAIAEGKVEARFVTKTWRSTHDNRTRHTHRVLNGQSVQFDAAFTSPSGATIRYPGDPDAPPSEHIGCRCTMDISVDYTAQLIERTSAA